MKKIFFILLFSLHLVCFSQSDKDSFVLKKADSAVLEKVKLGFAVPDIPAFKALGLDPSNILRPSEAKELALTLGSFRSDGDFIIPKNMAVEIAPALLINPTYYFFRALWRIQAKRSVYLIRHFLSNYPEIVIPGSMRNPAGLHSNFAF